MLVTAMFFIVPFVLFLNRKRLSPFRWVKAGRAVVLTGMTGKQRVITGPSRYSLFFEQEMEVSWTRSVDPFKGTQIPVTQVLHQVNGRLYRSRVEDVLTAVSNEDPWKSLELELSILETPTASSVHAVGKRYGLTVEQALLHAK